LLVTHSKMYAMGEKYQAPGLKALATRKFNANGLNTMTRGLGTAIVIAFMGTPETYQELREEIIDALAVKIGIAKNPAMDMTIKEIPELVYALYRKLLNRF
jgi:NAD/NADP transhydrogenase beta subunit